jgi:hypothetical protein
MKVKKIDTSRSQREYQVLQTEKVKLLIAWALILL